jgi:hypothetical protein
MAGRDEIVDAVTRELQLAGVDYQIEHGSKHPRIRFVLNGKSQFYVTPRYSGNWRLRTHARTGIRRVLRQAAAEARP